MSNNIDLPESEVIVKMSTCQVCEGFVRVSVKHMLTTKAATDFAKEAMKHNLKISEAPLLEYRKLDLNICKCNSK